MSRGRTFIWQSADGVTIPLQDVTNGYRVLRGVLGLGKPSYTRDEEQRPDLDGVFLRGVRSSGRQIFLPMEITGSTRLEFLQRKQNLASAMDPEKGPGYLLITDGGITRRIACIYAEGLEGDESRSVSGEEGLSSWCSTGITLAAEPFFSDTLARTFSFGYAGAVPFFPILPLRLNSAQVLSTVSTPVTKNYVTNPSFENNTTDWVLQLLAETPITSITRTAVFSKFGSFCAQAVYPQGTNGPCMVNQASDLGVGTLRSWSCWVYVPSGQPPVRLRTFSGNGNYSSTNDQWERITLTASQALSSEFIQIQPDSSVVGGNFYFDGAMVIDGNQQDYIDGDQSNCIWIGTAGNSASNRLAIYSPYMTVNPGTKQSWAVWQITGPATSFDFVNTTSGRRLAMSGYSVPADKVVTIDTEHKRVTAEDGTNLYQYLTADDFWPIEPGSNGLSLALAGAASQSFITGYYFPKSEVLV